MSLYHLLVLFERVFFLNFNVNQFDICWHFLSVVLSDHHQSSPTTSDCRERFRAKANGSVGDNWSYKTWKVPVKSSPPTNQPQTFLHARRPSCCPPNCFIILSWYCCTAPLSLVERRLINASDWLIWLIEPTASKQSTQGINHLAEFSN